MSRTGGADCVVFATAEEAENVAILVSEWLELDAADEWVRHDAEIVRSSSLIHIFSSTYPITNT